MTYGNNEETHCLRTNSRTRCQSAYQVRGCMVQARVSRHRVKEWLTQKQNQWTTWHFEYLEYNILLFDLKIHGENYEILKSSRQEKTRCECQDQSHGNLTTAGEWLAVITEVYKQIAHLMEADITTLKSRKGQRHVYRRKVDSYRGEGPQTPNRTSLPYMLLKEETFLHSGRIPSPVSLRTQQATWAEFLSSCRQPWQCLPAMHPILGHLLCSCMATQHIYSFLQSFPSWVREDLSAP